ncbi:glycosyltransferase [Cohnella rhizosphaerae]|uniref:Glycosyltransferase n=2 Tax=Cohnella rhizosphaerae TaxID=1457232 RepID=A0A9X4KWK0_9BACL|nr:glycosyltransferase [Cohnella rhizosphaerae]
MITFFLSDSKLNGIMRRIFYPFANGFIHQTKWARDFLKERYKFKCPDIILPNPLWINDFPVRKPIPKRAIAVGRLAEQKNYKGLIRAFKLVIEADSEIKLFIYGEGEQKKELQSLITSLKIEKKCVSSWLKQRCD